MSSEDKLLAYYSFRFQVQITNHKSQITSHRSQVTNNGELVECIHLLDRLAVSTRRSNSLSSFSEIEWSSVNAETNEERELLK